jgi:hypothetical protein
MPLIKFNLDNYVNALLIFKSDATRTDFEAAKAIFGCFNECDFFNVWYYKHAYDYDMLMEYHPSYNESDWLYNKYIYVEFQNKQAARETVFQIKLSDINYYTGLFFNHKSLIQFTEMCKHAHQLNYLNTKIKIMQNKKQYLIKNSLMALRCDLQLKSIDEIKSLQDSIAKETKIIKANLNKFIASNTITAS